MATRKPLVLIAGVRSVLPSGDFLSPSDSGATATGAAIFTVPDPGAISFLRINADNTVSALPASSFKTALSLNNVENTALSTWAGSTNITTLGTITGQIITTYDGGNALNQIRSYGAVPAEMSEFRGMRSRGSVASPSDVIANDSISRLSAYSWVNGAFRYTGSLTIYSIDVGATYPSGRFVCHLTDSSDVHNNIIEAAWTGNVALGLRGIGNYSFDSTARSVLSLCTGVAPAGSPADSVQLYSADFNGVAGAACLHVRTEGGTIARLNQDVSTLASPSFAGLTVDTSSLYVDSVSHRVGVGTTSPAYQLQVRRAGGAGSLGIGIDGVGVIDRAVQHFAVGDTTSVTTGHVFYTRNGSSTDLAALMLTGPGDIIGFGSIKTAAPSGHTATAVKFGEASAGTFYMDVGGTVIKIAYTT